MNVSAGITVQNFGVHSYVYMWDWDIQ